jgi:uncharacterized protein YigA (DUF484 family)
MSKNEQKIDEKKVKDFLLTNKEFFVNNPDLIQELEFKEKGKTGKFIDFKNFAIAELQKTVLSLKIDSKENKKIIASNNSIITSTKNIIQVLVCDHKNQKKLESELVLSLKKEFDLAACIFIVDKNTHSKKINEELKYHNVYCGKIEKSESVSIFNCSDIKSVIMSELQIESGSNMAIAIGSKADQYFHDKLDTAAFSIIKEIFQLRFNQLSVKK